MKKTMNVLFVGLALLFLSAFNSNTESSIDQAPEVKIISASDDLDQFSRSKD
jgi:hypothetical protein